MSDTSDNTQSHTARSACCAPSAARGSGPRLLALVIALLLGALARDLLPERASAQQQPAFDRPLVERMMRALETSAKANEASAKATEELVRAVRRGQGVREALNHSEQWM